MTRQEKRAAFDAYLAALRRQHILIVECLARRRKLAFLEGDWAEYYRQYAYQALALWLITSLRIRGHLRQLGLKVQIEPQLDALRKYTDKMWAMPALRRNLDEMPASKAN